MKRVTRGLVLVVLLGLLCISAAATLGDVDIVFDGSPLRVNLSLSTYPGLGQETTVMCTVVGAWDMSDVFAEIEMPEGAALVKGELKWTGALKAKEPVTFEATIAFHRTGKWGVRAKALAIEGPDTSWSDVAYAYLTVEEGFGTEGLTAFGGDPRRVRVEQVELGDAPVLEEQLEIKPDKESVAPEPPALDPATAKESSEIPAAVVPQGNLTVSGRWKYYDRHGWKLPLPNIMVQLVRGDNNNHLAFAYTNYNGYFTFPAVSNPGSAGIKVRAWTYVKWAPNDYELMIVQPCPWYNKNCGRDWHDSYYGETSRYVFGNGSKSVGTWEMVRPSQDPKSKAAWGQVDLDQAFFYPSDQPGGAIVEWSPTSTRGVYFYPRTGHIYLRGGYLDDVPHAILHEYGHNVMWNIYGRYLPRNDCPRNHSIRERSGPNCAWTEGWASFWALAVIQDTSFRWPGGGAVSLEAPTWFKPNWDEGIEVEGRVAGTLLDIMDSDRDGYDWYSSGFQPIWQTVYNQNDDRFIQFWRAWQRRGYDRRVFRAAAFQNTIDLNYKPRFTLIWGADPRDLDLHLWLPKWNPYHVYYRAMGNLTAFPWANLDVDDLVSYGPENITIAKPYKGTYVLAVDRYSPSGNIAGTGARVTYWLGPYWRTSWTVPSSGTGRWWHVADINGSTGWWTTKNTTQNSRPGPYATGPADLGEVEKPK